MARGEIKDIAASVRARLLDHARGHQIEFNLVLRRYFFERLVYRLSRSDARSRFVLKGAMLLRTWSDSPYRATVDLDLLRVGGSGRDEVRDDFLHILDANTETSDGARFDSEGRLGNRSSFFGSGSTDAQNLPCRHENVLLLVESTEKQIEWRWNLCLSQPKPPRVADFEMTTVLVQR